MFDHIGYLAHLQRKDYSLNTIKSRRRILKRLERDLEEFSHTALEKYLSEQMEAGKKASYLNHIILTLRDYCKFKDILQEIQNYKFYTPKNAVKATLSIDEIRAFLELPPLPFQDQDSYKTYTYFFTILASTGARPGEIAGLRPENVKLNEGIITIARSKTGNQRNIPIPSAIKPILNELLINANGLIFRNANGYPIQNHNWSRKFHDRIERLGIKRQGLSVYSLRHSFITSLIENDVSIFKVQKLVGHRKIETTAQYTHLTQKDVVGAIKKHPLNHLETTTQDPIKAILSTIQKLDVLSSDKYQCSLSASPNSLKLEIELRS